MDKLKCEICEKKIKGNQIQELFFPIDAFLITSQIELPKLICKECNEKINRVCVSCRNDCQSFSSLSECIAVDGIWWSPKDTNFCIGCSMWGDNNQKCCRHAEPCLKMDEGMKKEKSAPFTIRWLVDAFLICYFDNQNTMFGKVKEFVDGLSRLREATGF